MLDCLFQMEVLIYIPVEKAVKKRKSPVSNGTGRKSLLVQFWRSCLTPTQTVTAWLAELLAYVLLAYAEERHLSGKHGDAHDDYISRVPFLVPLLKTERTKLEVVASIAAPTILLFLLIWAQ